MASHRARRYTLGGLLLLMATAVLAALALSGVGPISSDADAAVGGQTWADEFDGPAGSAPDQDKWKLETGGSGFGNNELQYYTNSKDNVALDGEGHLVITARKGNPGGKDCWYGSCQYSSAKLTTAGTFTQTYGRFEARIKIPRGQGIWPAFWMLGDDIGTVGWPDSGEIDIMENVGHEPGTVHGSLHGPGYSGGNPITGSHKLPGGKAFADDFHTFSVEWAPDSVSWSIDGVEYQKRTPADAAGKRWAFDHPFYMMLNVAVGGNWPGSPDASTQFPQTMIVDHVRVRSWDEGDGGDGGDNGGGDTGGDGGDGGSKTGQITGIGGMCVDVAGASRANETPIQLHPCSGHDAQKWTVGGDGTVRALGKCLDVSGGSTSAGARVQLYDCNGTGAQKWTFTSDRELVNPQSDNCLDATGNSSADGTRLQTWSCHGGANQKWNLP